jgi:hypothetical protein
MVPPVLVIELSLLLRRTEGGEALEPVETAVLSGLVVQLPEVAGEVSPQPAAAAASAWLAAGLAVVTRPWPSSGISVI